MKIFKILATVLGLTMATTATAQQPPMYSQYMFNMMNINPAAVGHRQSPNVTMLFRNQWVNFKGAPTTGTVTYDNGINESNHSWGGQVYYDKIGIESTTGIQGFYSYTAPFENAKLAMGISFGAMNYSIDYTKTNPYDVGDPSLQYKINRFLPTAGVGALLSGDRWYVGLSAPALFKTKVTTLDQNAVSGAGADGHYFLSGGYAIPINEMITLKPSTLIKATYGAPLQFDLNMNVWMNDLIGFGLSYRTSDALVGMVEVKIKDKFRFGYSYDYNLSDLRYYNGGTHELMFRFELTNKNRGQEQGPSYF